jgi:hypothetical protein
VPQLKGTITPKLLDIFRVRRPYLYLRPSHTAHSGRLFKVGPTDCYVNNVVTYDPNLPPGQRSHLTLAPFCFEVLAVPCTHFAARTKHKLAGTPKKSSRLSESLCTCPKRVICPRWRPAGPRPPAPAPSPSRWPPSRAPALPL